MDLTTWLGHYHNLRTQVMPYNKDLTEDMFEDDKVLDTWWIEYLAREERKRTGHEELHDSIPKDSKPLTPEALNEQGPAMIKIFSTG